jgi:sn-glycerol 3-phosphate transport system ATP-binding protein
MTEHAIMLDPTAVSLRGLSKSWGAHQVLREIDLDVERGQFTALLGPSGCGKSTLLRLIAGLETADAGSVAIDGRDVGRMPPAERNLSMVFQSYALFPHLSVAQNIAFGLQVRRVARAERERRVADALAITGLVGLEARKPAALSGGQRQRVALARAIVAGHSLCLMDEPLSNLDAKLRHSVRLEIRALQRQLGMTVIYVTHDQTEAMGMADRIVLMNAGQVEQSGTPAELYHAPRSTFVASFIGSPPMALLPEASVPAALRLGARASTAAGSPLFGVRPEDFEITTPGEHVMSGVVTGVEFQGAESYIYVTTPQDDRIIVRADQRDRMEALAENQTVGLVWRPSACHVFDSASGQRVAPALSLATPRSPAFGALPLFPKIHHTQPSC